MIRTTYGILFGLLLALLVAGAAAVEPANTTVNGTPTTALAPSITAEVFWQETYGAYPNTTLLSLLFGAEDDYVLAGVVAGDGDLILVRANRTGVLLDQRRVPFGPGGSGSAAAVSSTADKGLVAVGSARSVAPGDEDVALLRLGADGSLIWSRSFAIGSGVDRGTAVMPAMDGGFLVAGTTASPTGGSTDLLLIRVDEAGGKVWHRIHPMGAGLVRMSDIKPAPGGGYLLVGSTDAGRAGMSAVLLVKITADGSRAWQRTYAEGTRSTRGVTLVPGSDGGLLLLAGVGEPGRDPTGTLLVSVDTDGRERWRAGLGGNVSIPVLAHDLAAVDPQGYLVAGQTGETGASRSLLTLVDRTGREAWNLSWSIGSTADRAGAVIVSGPDQFLVAGDTFSSPGRDSALYLAAIGVATVAPNVTVNVTPTAVESPAGNLTATPTVPPSTLPTPAVETTTSAPAGLVSLLAALSAAGLLVAFRRR